MQPPSSCVANELKLCADEFVHLRSNTVRVSSTP
jgi:hypothetical protein